MFQGYEFELNQTAKLTALNTTSQHCYLIQSLPCELLNSDTK